MRTMKVVMGVLACGYMCMYASVSRADDNTDYCNKVHARAASDAALMFFPSVQAQFIKFPGTSASMDLLTTGTTTPNGYQVRALMTWSPLDVYKGLSTQAVGEADCQQHRAMVDAMNVITSIADVGKLPALRKQVDYLRTNQTRWRSIVEATEQRLKANIITLDDSMRVREKALLLDRKLTEMQGQADTIAAKNLPETSKDIASLASSVVYASMTFEQKSNRVRSLDAWTTGVSFGLVPPVNGVSETEWLGVISVGFNFGAFSHNHEDDNYLEARKSELRNARYEMEDELRKFKDQIAATLSATIAETNVIELEKQRLTVIRNTVQKTEAAATPALLNAIDLEMMDLESDSIFLDEFRNQISQWK